MLLLHVIPLLSIKNIKWKKIKGVITYVREIIRITHSQGHVFLCYMIKHCKYKYKPSRNAGLFTRKNAATIDTS